MSSRWSGNFLLFYQNMYLMITRRFQCFSRVPSIFYGAIPKISENMGVSRITRITRDGSRITKCLEFVIYSRPK